MQHFHIGLVDVVKTGATVVIFATIWHLIAYHNHANALGQAMMFIL